MNTVLSKYNIAIRGNGSQPMLFAHGFGCDQNMWRFVAPAFERDYRVVLFDLIGAGNSDKSAYVPAKYSTLHGYASDVIEICEALALRDVILVGHSVSALIGILAAIARPELFARLILVGPSPCYINDGDYVGGFNRSDIDSMLHLLDSNYLGWSSNMAPVIMGNPERPELGRELENSFCKADPEIQRQFARVTFLSDHRADLLRVKTPALVLQCSSDVIAPISVGEYTHRQLAGSQLVIMNATGHCPNLSAPAETIEAMKGFLRNDAPAYRAT